MDDAAWSQAMLTSPAARAQDRAKPSPEEQTGVKVGEKAPKFKLKDQEGRERSLDDLLGRRARSAGLPLVGRLVTVRAAR